MPQDRCSTAADGRNFAGRKLLRLRCRRLRGACCLRRFRAARAGDDDVHAIESFTDKFMNTLGLKNPGDPQYGINYSERSPLVVPPTRDLPPPQSANGPPAPELAEGSRYCSSAKPKQEREAVDPPRYRHRSRRARCAPDELNVGGRAGTAVNPLPAPAIRASLVRSRHQERPASASIGSRRKSTATFTGEPPRVSLTDPPPGYQTPSPDQPYGIAPEKKVYKPPTLGERMEPAR